MEVLDKLNVVSSSKDPNQVVRLRRLTWIFLCVSEIPYLPVMEQLKYNWLLLSQTPSDQNVHFEMTVVWDKTGC